jgi:hypothetical protein
VFDAAIGDIAEMIRAESGAKPDPRAEFDKRARELLAARKPGALCPLFLD